MLFCYLAFSLYEFDYNAFMHIFLLVIIVVLFIRFVVYKYPEVSGSSDPWIHKGLGHVYADLQSKEWTTNKKSLNESGHAIYNTLQQIYDGKDHGKKVSIFVE